MFFSPVSISLSYDIKCFHCKRKELHLFLKLWAKLVQGISYTSGYETVSLASHLVNLLLQSLNTTSDIPMTIIHSCGHQCMFTLAASLSLSQKCQVTLISRVRPAF